MPPLLDELFDEVIDVLRNKWTVTNARVVPGVSDLPFANSAKEFEGTVLYADLADSTALVDQYPVELCAELYKCYLVCAARIVRRLDGEITAFDGDRIMAIFIGDGMETRAALSALKLNAAVRHVIRPAFKEAYPYTPGIPLRIRHGVGIDRSSLFAAKIGIRTSPDLVWVGRAANYAAKLATFRTPLGLVVHITPRVYRKLDQALRQRSGEPIWRNFKWEKLSVYRSSVVWDI